MVYYPIAEHKSLSEPALRRLAELEESRGQLIQVHEAEGQCIAVFSWGAVYLPEELAGRLRELIGRKIGVLRLDGWHVRELPEA